MYKQINMSTRESISANSKIICIFFVIIVAIVAGMPILSEYVHLNYQLMIILIIAPFTVFVVQPQVKTWRFAVFSIIFLGLYIILKIQSMFFFGFMFFILLTIELNLGKLNNIPIFIIIALTPLTSYFFNIFGFPLRVELSKVAANILNYVFPDTISNGNIIRFEGNDFSVDPECMGLNMFITGIVSCLFIISWFEKKDKASSSIFLTGLILLIYGFFITISNLFRIILIVVFRLKQETIMHDVAGILCLFVYVLLPMFFIIRLFSRYFKPISIQKYANYNFLTGILKKIKNRYIYWIFNIILLIFIAYIGINHENYKIIPTDKQAEQINIPGMKKQKLEHNVISFSNKLAIVYIKPPVRIYAGDHSPAICWKGCGYKLRGEKIATISGQQVYFAELNTTNKEKLYTLWWYDNGQHTTTSQLEWRWKTIKGEPPYRLINITSDNPDTLKTVASDIMNRLQTFVN